jgi:hypothetical protein
LTTSSSPNALCPLSAAHLDAFLSDSDRDRTNRDTRNDVDGKAKTVIMQFGKPIVLVIGMCERSGKHFDIVAVPIFSIQDQNRLLIAPPAL